MSLLKRIKNIIKSNIEFGKDINIEDINVDSFDDAYYEDAKDIPKGDNLEKKYYQVLGVEYGANFKKIKSAYRLLLKKYHPDLYLNDEKKLKTAQKLTQKINEAYTYFERKYQ